MRSFCHRDRLHLQYCPCNELHIIMPSSESSWRMSFGLSGSPLLGRHQNCIKVLATYRLTEQERDRPRSRASSISSTACHTPTVRPAIATKICHLWMHWLAVLEHRDSCRLLLSPSQFPSLSLPARSYPAITTCCTCRLPRSREVTPLSRETKVRRRADACAVVESFHRRYNGQCGRPTRCAPQRDSLTLELSPV
ncbi:hypothetical protein DAEQUDRAFT_109755 [Daedalea quercina L-15889]|uniref:Uncharacterized protein n=1 Tax=Daedalea quercina L-15889 TaxID=1314783 RepID=A0A165S4I3_9APHY|nr:hypothetical protein DAEQUDRAFT_109755 [Daedalea quercina L-15889]